MECIACGNQSPKVHRERKYPKSKGLFPTTEVVECGRCKTITVYVKGELIHTHYPVNMKLLADT